jgi:hypothetical protein
VAAGATKFGDLLVQLELISEDHLDEALRLAPQSGLPVGKALVLLGHLSETELQVAVELQSLINQKDYPILLAKKITTLVRSGLSPAEAMKTLQAQLTPTAMTSIGQLFLDANVLNHGQLEDAQRASYQNGMRMGRMLVLKGLIDSKELDNVLRLQTLLRNKQISRVEAVETLSKDHAAKLALPKRAKNPNANAPAAPTRQVRFTEFMVSAGLASEPEMLNAVQTSNDRRLSLGEAIVSMGLVSQRVYDIAIDLYTKVSSGQLAFQDATDRLHRTVFGDPQHGQSGSCPPLGEILKMTNLVTDHDIAQAVALSSKYPSVIGKMLVLSGAIDEATLIASLRCQFLVKNGHLRLDDGIKALKYSKEHGMSFDDSLEELGLHTQEMIHSHH